MLHMWGLRFHCCSSYKTRPQRTRRKREEKGSRDVVKRPCIHITRRGLKEPCRLGSLEIAQADRQKRTLYAVTLPMMKREGQAHVCGWLNCSSPGQIMEILNPATPQRGWSKGFCWNLGRVEGDSRTLETRTRSLDSRRD
ncbi:hypothetical protein AVEN_48265-1 [Araneus ventricosus]|uniref:Uncharacterized protein n=1 Tax=Araneus ventricosus TaxID=182803 RepID=A0A4Y2EKM2_ARAVE|nr:hypothetical protein AVEN_48265-1 [Araneus ventricosus]